MIRIKALFCTLCLFLALSLTACSFNGIMYRHLSDESNYETHALTLEGVYVCNKETGWLERYDEAIHDESYLTATVYFGVTDLERLGAGEVVLEDGTKTEPIVLLEVIPENSKMLLENGFYEDFVPKSVLEIVTSTWIYMDGEFFYVIGVAQEKTRYLDSDVGLKNIVEMMDENRSLL